MSTPSQMSRRFSRFVLQSPVKNSVAGRVCAWPDELMKIRISASVIGALGIAAAAFGAHGLENIASPEQVRWWAIGAAIQLVTAPCVLLAALHRDQISAVVGWLWVVGVGLFSGSLYAMALGGPRSLGAVTPLGGVALVAAWLGLLFPFSKPSSKEL